MSAYLTEYEAWLEIAEHMRGSGCIPTRLTSGSNYGLCSAIASMFLADAITGNTYWAMRRRLIHKYRHLKRSGSYYWTPGLVTPRIKACDELAKECRGNVS